MPRGSFGRKVARAAQIGGSHSYRARPPLLWSVSMVVVVVGGLSLIGYSRAERLSKTTASSEPPTKTDNWHAAFAIDICGTLQPNLPANTNFTAAGIRTFGDGVIDVNPGAVSNSSAFTGKNDTLATFISSYGQGFALSATSLTMPGKPSTTTSTSTSTSSTVPASSSSTSSTSSSSTTTSAASSTTTASTKTSTKTSTKGVTASFSSAASKATTTSAPASAASPATTTPGAAASPATSSTTAAATTTTAVPVTTTTTAIVPGPTYTNGGTCPSTSKTPGKASLVAKVWPSPTGTPTLVTTNLGAIRILDGGMITLAYVPKGSAIPEPASRKTLLQDLGSASASSGKKK